MDGLDVLRGATMVWMVAYHAAYDANLHGWLQPRQQFNTDLFWLAQRTAIVSLFLFCAGWGQALAWRAAQPAARFWKRWGQIAACALLVSLGSSWMFPKRWIFFGVLHAFAVMLPLARWMAPALASRPGLGWALAALCLSLPAWAASSVFDAPAWQWLGLMTHKPATEDYVPMLPWFGVLLAGLSLGLASTAQGRGVHADVADADRPAWWRGLRTLGRWPLSVYMAHQPLLLGLMALVALLASPQAA